MAIILILTACGDEDVSDTRRFANERPPTIALSTATAAVEGTTTPLPVAPPASSPGALLATRGAPERLYFSSPTEMWTVGADGSNPRAVLHLDPEQGVIRSTAQAPGVDGTEVAALIVRDTGDGETARLVFLNRDGDVLRRIDRLEAVLGDDPPEGASATAVSWSPQGDVLLVTFGSAGVVSIPTDGEPTLLLPAEATSTINDAAWSPAGDAIAFLSAIPDSTDLTARQLVVAPVADAAIDPARIVVVSRAGDGVGSYAWLPDGSGLLYTDTGAIGGTTGGDLFSVGEDGSNLQLVASAGRAAPVAQIVDFAVSPDGSSLAYTIATPDQSGERLIFHSLWLRVLDTNETVAVPIPTNQAVAELWWTANGLVWRSEPLETEADTQVTSAGFTIERLDRDSQQAVLFSATPAATPIADGVGSPVASPVGPASSGSIDATPGTTVSTPEASPVASPDVLRAIPAEAGTPSAVAR